MATPTAAAAAATTALSKLCQCNLGLLSQKLSLMQAMTVKHGATSAKEFFQTPCKIVGASVGQHFRHSLDHMEYAAKIAAYASNARNAGQEANPQSLELHYDLRTRGCVSEHDMDAAAERIFGVIHSLEILSIRQEEHAQDTVEETNTSVLQFQLCDTNHTPPLQLHPAQAYFMLAGDSDQEYALHTSIGRELGFAAHHAIHHLAMVKIIAIQSCGLTAEELPEGFGKAPSTIRFDVSKGEE